MPVIRYCMFALSLHPPARRYPLVTHFESLIWLDARPVG